MWQVSKARPVLAALLGADLGEFLVINAAMLAVVLPLMLFHQMQLMICAVIAQHYARTALETVEA